MPATLIIGYGQTLRSDDGVGPKAALALDSQRPSAELRVVSVQQLMPELAESIASASRVLFLDSGASGTPGEIRCQKISRDRGFEPSKLSHHLTPSGLLELAARYFEVEPDAWLLTLTGASFEFGEDFSYAVGAAWPSYLDRVRAFLV